MKITLRKASVLQQHIQDAIKSITLTSRVSLNEFQNAGKVLATAKHNLLNNLARLTELSNCLATIRSLVGVANVESGVHGKLAELSVTEKMIHRYTELLTGADKAEELEVIEGKIGKLRTSDKATYYGTMEFETGLLTTEDISQFEDSLRRLRRLKQTLNDHMLELNIRTEIEIPDTVIKVLETEKIG